MIEEEEDVERICVCTVWKCLCTPGNPADCDCDGGCGDCACVEDALDAEVSD